LGLLQHTFVEAVAEHKAITLRMASFHKFSVIACIWVHWENYINNKYIATHVTALHPACNVRIPPMHRLPFVLPLAPSESAWIRQQSSTVPIRATPAGNGARITGEVSRSNELPNVFFLDRTSLETLQANSL
jgi:hypothetical protein